MTEQNTTRRHLFPPERLNCKCDEPVEKSVMEYVVCDVCGGYLGMEDGDDGE